MAKDIKYPAEITFKAVFKNDSNTILKINLIMEKSNIKASITSKESKNGNFISYTITSVFSSNDSLNQLCSEISSLNNFRMIF